MTGSSKPINCWLFLGELRNICYQTFCFVLLCHILTNRVVKIQTTSKNFPAMVHNKRSNKRFIILLAVPTRQIVISVRANFVDIYLPRMRDRSMRSRIFVLVLGVTCEVGVRSLQGNLRPKPWCIDVSLAYGKAAYLVTFTVCLFLFANKHPQRPVFQNTKSFYIRSPYFKPLVCI